MKKIIDFFKNWFENNGFIKLIIALIIFGISAIIVNNTNSFVFLAIFNVIGLTAIAYVVIASLVYVIAGFVNTIKDIFRK